MTDLRSKTCCVVDHGLFLELALRLGRDFGRVLYHTPWEVGFPKLEDCIIGDGFEAQNVERCQDIWREHADLYVFPDVLHGGMQYALKEMGANVWGSGDGDQYELRRAYFKEKQKEQGMDVPRFETFHGITALRAFLEDKEDMFVKVSLFRGSHETWKWRNAKLDGGFLDTLAVRFGGAKELVPFMVEYPIDTPLEVGYDGYCIDGRYPALGIQGYEIKDRAYVAALQGYDELPEPVRRVNGQMSPLLARVNYRNFFSTEIRLRDFKAYLIDPCCRCPSPATEAQLELYGNLGEIIWEGAQGHLIDPEPTAKFAVEAIMQHNGDEKEWRPLDVPAGARQWVKVYHACQIEGMLWIPPADHLGETIGAVVGIGNTLEDAIAKLHEHVEAIKHNPVTVHTEAVVEALAEIHKAEAKGIEFSEQPTPDPETALKT